MLKQVVNVVTTSFYSFKFILLKIRFKLKIKHMWSRMQTYRMTIAVQSHLIGQEILTLILEESLKLIENFVP